jgi:hypothetical protein
MRPAGNTNVLVEDVSYCESKRPLRHSRIDWLRRLSCVIRGSGVAVSMDGDNDILTVEDDEVSQSFRESYRCVASCIVSLCKMSISRNEWTCPADGDLHQLVRRYLASRPRDLSLHA